MLKLKNFFVISTINRIFVFQKLQATASKKQISN